MGIDVLVTETTPNEIHEKLCNEYDIRMALHNHPKTWPPDAVLKACKDRGKLIGSCCDTGHWMRAEFVPVEYAQEASKAASCTCTSRTSTSSARRHDVPWGTGKGDPKGMLAELKRQGYKGYLSIEYEYGELAGTWRPTCPSASRSSTQPSPS